jgi:hypothetical protein
MLLLEAMGRMEGFGKPGTRPTRNNNPGDIEYGRFAIAHGATGTDGRFAIFATPQAGYACMAALLGSAYAGMTIEAALNKYAPPVENNTNLYLQDILEWTGLQATDIISQHLDIPA